MSGGHFARCALKHSNVVSFIEHMVPGVRAVGR